MNQQQQDPIFNNMAAYAAALKILIAFITYRFKSLSSDLIYDICEEALITTYYYENLTTSILCFAKGVAKRRSLDQVKRNKVRTKHLSLMNYNDCFDPNTEGGDWEECYDDDKCFLLNRLSNFIHEELTPKSKQLLEADLDSAMDKFTDIEKARKLGLTPTSTATRRRRNATKTKMVASVKDTPQYLRVVHQRKQRA